MAKECEIKSYIKDLNISERARNFLNNTHNDVFNKLKDSKSFRYKDGYLFTKKNDYNSSLAAVNNINREYGEKVASIVKYAKSPNQSIVKINTSLMLKHFEEDVRGVDFFKNDWRLYEQEEKLYKTESLQNTPLIKEGVDFVFEQNPKFSSQIYEALGFTGNISLESNLKNTGKTEQELTEYLKNKYPEIKLNITNNPVWEYDEEVFNQFFNKKIKNIALIALISYSLWNANAQIINSNIQYKDDITTAQILKKIASDGYVYTDSNGIIINKNDTVNKEAYNFLKELWEKAGYPKIVIKIGEGKSRYNPITNSITINIIRKDDIYSYIEVEKDKNGNNIYGISADLFLAEFAHGLQAAQGKMYAGKQIIDFIKSGFIYDNSYETEGTLEYEAHEEIEPLLVEEFENYLYQQTVNNKIIGQANIKAMTVLIDAVNKKADTIPHEYAHHYIAWFRDSKIVQEGIKRFGSEEALVQAIGEQVIKQKGEAYNWWKKFTNFILSLLSDKKLLQVLTDSFLNRADLSNDFTYNEITPQQEQQAKQLYSSYLDTIFPDSKVKDIVYHGTKGEKFDRFKPSEKGEFGKGVYFGNYQTALENTDVLDDFTLEPKNGFDKNKIVPAVINTENIYKRDLGGNGTRNEYVVEPEQIHILSSKADIQGFKDFMVFKNSEFSKYGTYQQFRDFISHKSSIEIENNLIQTGKIDRVC